MAKESFIIDGVRSPIGLKNSPLLGIRSDDLAASVIMSLLERNVNYKDKIEDLILGCAFPEGPQGMLMAKGTSILSNLPIHTSGKVVNRFCGSSMDSIHQLSQAIIAEDMSCGIAGGVEDMFSVPMGGFNPSFNPILYEKDYYMGMGETAENLANELGISRSDQEEFAIGSHKKALMAIEEGKYNNEIVPIEFNGNIVDLDEGPREPNIDKIKSLEPAFDGDGTITAATSSPISIGAAAVLLSDDSAGAKYKIKARAVCGVDWTKMGMGPLPATNRALKSSGLTIDDIDVIELNEAFAAQSLYVIRKGGWDMDKINLNGGAIALGHPLGCSGARIIVTLINVMEQNESNLGLATMCIGTGQGIATIIERVS